LNILTLPYLDKFIAMIEALSSWFNN